jgi:hypothetical protein
MTRLALGAYLVHLAQTLRAEDQDLRDAMARMHDPATREDVVRVAEATRSVLLYTHSIALMLATFLDAVPDCTSMQGRDES